MIDGLLICLIQLLSTLVNRLLNQKIQSPVNFLDLILYLESLPWLQFLKSLYRFVEFFRSNRNRDHENHLPLRMVINFDCDRIQVPFYRLKSISLK